MKIFRRLCLGLVLVLMPISSLTFVRAASVADLTKSIETKKAEISATQAKVDQLNKDLVAATGALELMKKDMDEACALTNKQEDEVGAWETGDCGDMVGDLIFAELISESEKSTYEEKCSACQAAYKKYMYSPANQVKASLNQAKSDLEFKKSQLAALEKQLEQAKESEKALDNPDYKTIQNLYNEAQTMSVSDCGSKLNDVTSGYDAVKKAESDAKDSLLNGVKSVSSELKTAQSAYDKAKAAYDTQCSDQEETVAETEEGNLEGENVDSTTEDPKAEETAATAEEKSGENATATETPTATEKDANLALSAYEKEIAKAEEWMTTTEGRRNYVPTKELREDLAPILENAEAAMLAEDWYTAMMNYNEATTKVLSANVRFLDRDYLELSDKNFDSILVDNKIVHIAGGFEGQNEERVGKTFFTKILPMVNRVIGVIGILYLIILGVKFILAQGDEEKMGKYKDQAIWLIIGLGLVSVAEFVGFDIFDPSQRDVLSDAAAKPFYEKLMQVVRFFEYVAMGLVLVNGIISGYKLITSGEEEETVSQEKKFLKSFIIGTIFILMAEVIVRVLSYQDSDLSTTQDILIQEVAGILNFVLTFIGGVAVLMLIMSSIYYVTSFGNEDQMNRAKRMIITAIGGIVIAFSAFTIAQFLVNH